MIYKTHVFAVLCVSNLFMVTVLPELKNNFWKFIVSARASAISIDWLFFLPVCIYLNMYAFFY